MRDTTSASNLFRRKLCPGSHHAEEGIIDEAGDAADEGTLLHPFACNPKLKRDHLTEEQRRILKKADFSTRDFLVAAEREFQAPSIERARWIEERLTVHGPDGEELFSGQCDVAFDFAEEKGVAVQDFKLGFLDVTPAPVNYQVASYGIAWTDYLNADRALVAINQPRGTETLTLARYDRRTIEAARREIASIYHAALDRNAPRIAGETQCAYCRAKLFCEEYGRRFRPLAHAPESRTVATLDNDQLGMFAMAVRAAKRLEGPIMAEITKRIQNEEMEGWHLSENGEVRQVTDIVGAYNALRGYFDNLGGMDPKRFTECTELSLTRLAEYVRELTGFTTSRAKQLIEELLNPYIARKQKRPTPTPHDAR